MNFDHLKGIIAAPFTPFLPDNSLHLDLIPSYYKMLKHHQVRGAFICGSTGEGASMTYDEKLKVTQAWADACRKDDHFKVILFVGGTSIIESISLAQEGAKMGIDAIASTAPFYFKPNHITTLADCCLEIARSVPDLPYYYYHIPVLTGVDFPMIDLLKAIDGKASNFVGIKYTHENLMDFASCIHFQNRKYEMLWGRDESWLGALAMGAKGAVGSTYNYIPKLYHAISSNFEAGHVGKAQELQQKSIEMIGLLGKYGGMATGKSYMKWIGLDCGEFRLPVKNMDAAAYIRFEKEVVALGLDEYWAMNQ